MTILLLSSKVANDASLLIASSLDEITTEISQTSHHSNQYQAALLRIYSECALIEFLHLVLRFPMQFIKFSSPPQ